MATQILTGYAASILREMSLYSLRPASSTAPGFWWSSYDGSRYWVTSL